MAVDRSPSTAAGRAYESKRTLVTGGAENAELTLTGVRLGVDLIDTAIFYPKAVEPLPEDVTSKVTVAKDGVIKIAQATTNGRVLVFWRKRVP